MRVFRCFHDGPMREGARVALDPEEVEHLTRVRRVRAGEAVLVLDGCGSEYEGHLSEKHRGLVEVGRVVRSEPDAGPALELALALTRTGAFEEALSRAIELGATAWRPIDSERAVVHLDDRKRATRRERWQRLAVERLKQSERLWLPRIDEPIALEELLAALEKEGTAAITLMERSSGETPDLASALRTLGVVPVCLLVGPEGGWEASERAMLEAPGRRTATLGTAILRSETAALAGLAVAQSVRREF